MRLNTSQWDKVFPQYMKRTRRDLATVLNTKCFYIARRATVETPKASKAQIQALRKPRKKTSFTKKGKSKIVNTTAGALIINARLVKAGKPPLNQRDAKKAATTMINARLRAIAFLKSGWLPAIKKLEPLADRRGIPRQDKSGKQFGKPKGFAVAANLSSWRTACKIQNDALPASRRFFGKFFGGDRSGPLKYAAPALQRAFDFEVQSMKDYLAKKLAASAKEHGIRTR